MNTTIDTTLKGTYYIEDAKGNLLAEADNIITDWGMNRLFGNVPSTAYPTNSTPSYTQAFVNNLAVLHLGSSNTATTPGDSSLGSYITPTGNYTQTTDTTNTGSAYTFDGSGNATLTYTRSFQLSITAPQTFREIGMHHSAGGTAATVENGIFSRAILNPSVSVVAGDVLFIRYRLVITFTSYIDHGTLQFAYGAGTVGNIGRAKTVLQYPPFFGMTNTGAPAHILNNGHAWSSPDGIDDQYLKPLFEDFGNNDRFYVGDITNTGGSPGSSAAYPRKWKLMTYANANTGGTVPQYSTVTIPSSYTNGPGSDASNSSDICSITSPQQFSVASSVINNIGGSTNNTWSKRLRFIFRPGSFYVINSSNATVGATGIALFSASDNGTNLGWFPRQTNSYFYHSGVASCLFTTFENTYGPFDTASDTYVGFDYVFNFTRASS
jgi:hypothetical protein